jgi:hypothetical protein
MRGLGDFQRSQMKNNDPHMTEFFRCLRTAVDMLEQIVLRASSPAAEQHPEPRGREAQADHGSGSTET